ncbi:SRSF protein kinase 2-like isoform X2 [Gadus macrocephalus]|uniref:SRSF protein kinase 2-like isoform X2 n=1 Tax=Gadus macrocephalus TaxID=80720 RepID=UPI0028CB54BA|nr:SRSF protein kinase 2-like isoform X2 [Gadus macrocephalus]
MSSSYAAAFSALSLKPQENTKHPPSPPPPSDTKVSVVNGPPNQPDHPTIHPAAPVVVPQTTSSELLGLEDEQQESSEDYCVGGYYAVEIGEIFIDRYQVVRDSDPKDPTRENVVKLIDDFRVTGVNGQQHVCMVLEVLGHQLLKWIIKSNYHGLPLPCVRRIIKQVLQGLDYLHTKCKIIHTDIKPENILLRVDEVYIQRLAANTKLWQLPKSPASPSCSQNTSTREKQSLFNLLGKLNGVFHTLGTWTGRVSRRQMSRLSRKENRKRDGGGRDGGESTAGRGQGFKRHVSFVDDLTPPGTPSHDCPLKEQRRRPDKPFHRRSMTLLEDLDTEQSYPDTLPSPCSLTAARSPKARPRSLLLHQTAENHQQTSLSSSLQGVAEVGPVSDGDTVDSVDVLVNLLKPENADKILIKIADLGNACWVNKHFSEDIQTCQYRSVEVLIGADYGPPADIWSTACMAFELATGEYLFEPQAADAFSRDEDHIAHIMELLGPLPTQFALSGTRSKHYFNRKGQLRRISKLKPWSLCEILQDKFEWRREQAAQFSSFLLTMLEPQPGKRATATQCLRHPWLVAVS